MLSEEKIIELEDEFIVQSGSAFAQAYENAIASGHSVVIADNVSLFRVLSDGSREFVKDIEPLMPVKMGQKLQIL